jgi:hypothetical protein
MPVNIKLMLYKIIKIIYDNAPYTNKKSYVLDERH